jgi:hypothetical protein
LNFGISEIQAEDGKRAAAERKPLAAGIAPVLDGMASIREHWKIQY